MSITKQYEAMLAQALRESHGSVKTDTAEVAVYMAQRAAHLAAAVDEPGFHEAVVAERDNVALKVGITASRNARAIDARILGLIEGGLSMGAALIARGLGVP